MDNYDFNQIPHAPIERGKTPGIAWYLIEPVNTNEYDYPSEDDNGKPKYERVLEVFDSKTASLLAEKFDLANWMGIGIPVNKDHLHIRGGSTESYGWIKALHATDEGLWACVEWTEEGLGLINAGKYAFFSTEYPFADYVRDGLDDESGLPIVRPGCLKGLAITNYPANRRQSSMTRSAEAIPMRCRTSAAINKPHANIDMRPKKTDTRSRSEDEFKEDPNKEKTTDPASDGKTEDVKTNEEEKKKEDTQCNSEDEEFWASLLTSLGLDPTDTELDKEDILAAVEALAAENADLRDKVKTNRAKMGAASRLSRLGFRARREGDAPKDTPTLKPGEMSPDMQDMASYVDAHVGKVRARRESQGQVWRPEDFSAAVASAQNDWMRRNPGKIS